MLIFQENIHIPLFGVFIFIFTMLYRDKTDKNIVYQVCYILKKYQISKVSERLKNIFNRRNSFFFRAKKIYHRVILFNDIGNSKTFMRNKHLSLQSLA